MPHVMTCTSMITLVASMPPTMKHRSGILYLCHIELSQLSIPQPSIILLVITSRTATNHTSTGPPWIRHRPIPPWITIPPSSISAHAWLTTCSPPRFFVPVLGTPRPSRVATVPSRRCPRRSCRRPALIPGAGRFPCTHAQRSWPSPVLLRGTNVDALCRQCKHHMAMHTPF